MINFLQQMIQFRAGERVKIAQSMRVYKTIRSQLFESMLLLLFDNFRQNKKINKAKNVDNVSVNFLIMCQ